MKTSNQFLCIAALSILGSGFAYGQAHTGESVALGVLYVAAMLASLATFHE